MIQFKQSLLAQVYNGWGTLVKYKRSVYQIHYSQVQSCYYVIKVPSNTPTVLDISAYKAV